MINEHLSPGNKVLISGVDQNLEKIKKMLYFCEVFVINDHFLEGVDIISTNEVCIFPDETFDAIVEIKPYHLKKVLKKNGKII